MIRFEHKFTWAGAALATVNANSDASDHPGGSATFAVYGTFGGGTAKLQASFDGGTTYLDVPSASFTANGLINVQLAACKIRINLAGATTPSLAARMPGLPDD